MSDPVSQRLRRFASSPGAREAAAAFLVARLLGSLAAAIALAGIPSFPMAPALDYLPQARGPLYNMTIGLWERWDALWILRAAEQGWSAGNQGAAVFPLYPLAIRALHRAGIPWLVGALSISNVCFLVGLYLVYRLAEIDHGAETARRAVWLQALYPGSLFFLAPYSEALFLALSAGALYAARRRRWWLAGLLGGAASATRVVGVLVVGALAVEFWQQRREPNRVRLRSALSLLLSPLGLLAFILFWRLQSGNPFEFLVQSRLWGRSLMAPWNTLYLGLLQAGQSIDRYPRGVYLLEAGGAVALLAVAIGGLRVLRPSYSALLWLGILPLVVNPVPVRLFCSLLRYAAVLFPASIALAAMVRRPTLNEALRLLLAGLFALCTALFITSHWLF